MPSGYHKPDQKPEPAKAPPKLDPAKLAMVSDYLKRTVSARPYAFILESLVERLELDKADRKLTTVGIIPVPFNFDPSRFMNEKSVAFLPYCSKPFDCPSNVDFGRKSNKCQALDSECDRTACSVSRFIQAAKKMGIKEFHVIDSDRGLFEWLAIKKEEGYKLVIGAACEFAVSYALEVIHGQLGFDGLIITINGDKCKTKEEYSESESADRDRLTFVDDWTISTLDDLADHQVDHKRAGRKNQDKQASDE